MTTRQVDYFTQNFLGTYGDTQAGRMALEAVTGVYSGAVLPDECIHEAASLLARYWGESGKYSLLPDWTHKARPATRRVPTYSAKECKKALRDLERRCNRDLESGGLNAADREFYDKKLESARLLVQAAEGQTIYTPDGQLAAPQGTRYKRKDYPLGIKQIAVRLDDLAKSEAVKDEFTYLARLLNSLGFYDIETEQERAFKRGDDDWTAHLRVLVDQWRKQLADYKPINK